MGFKKTQLCVATSISLIFITCFGNILSRTTYSSTTPPKSQKIFNLPYSDYSQYGIIYDTDCLYYKNERIRYFEDNSTFYNGDGTISGSLIFHTDKESKGKIDVYTVHNSQNELTGIKVATEDEFISKTQDYFNTLNDIADYKEYGITTDMVGNIYFKESLVRELYDPAKGTFIQGSRGAGFPKNSIDIEAVYKNEQLSGFKVLSQKEYDMRTQERIDAVQDFWVEQQKKRD